MGTRAGPASWLYKPAWYKVHNIAANQAIALGFTVDRKTAKRILSRMARRGAYIRHPKGNLHTVVKGLGYVIDFGENIINGVHTDDGRDQRNCPVCGGSCRGLIFGKGAPCDVCENRGFLIF